MKTLKKILAFMGWAFVGLFALMFFGLIATLVLMLQKGISTDGDLAGRAIASERAVGVVEISGEILSADKFRRQLRKAVENERLKSIVVAIDSPGGAVGASEEMYREIQRARLTKPVVCALSNIAASGGLYAALGCQKIVTNQGTLTGSIGVIMMLPNLEQIADVAGLRMNVIKSGRFKDTGSPFRSFEPDDEALMQSLVDSAHEQFVAVIAESRGLPVERIREFADGRIILGSQAVEWGLADEIGGLSRAAQLALELAGITGEPEIIMPPKATGFMALFQDLADARLIRQLFTFGKLQLLYRAYP